MSSKQRRERPCNTHGTPSTSSGFTPKSPIVLINKTQQFYFRSKKKTSNKYTLRKLQSTKQFSTSQKITINKAVLYILENYKVVLYISENYNRQTTSQGKNHKKETKKKEGEGEKKGAEVWQKERALSIQSTPPLQA